jgi:hypothetical protein
MGPNTSAALHSARGRRNMSVGPNRGPPRSDQPRFGVNNNPAAQRNDPILVNPSIDEANLLRALYNKHMEDIRVVQGKDTERYVLRNYVCNFLSCGVIASSDQDTAPPHSVIGPRRNRCRIY